jgi:16S rRNA (cytosine967-C5)-methyltransferase
MVGMKPDEMENIYPNLLDAYKLSGIKFDLPELDRCTHKVFAEMTTDSRDAFLINSFPDFFGELLPATVQKEIAPIMAALNHDARVCIRVDTNKTSREKIVRSFLEQGAEASFSKISPLGVYLQKRIDLNGVEFYKSGAIEIQEEASQLVGLMVNPHEGEVIVDACAGGGGKSLQLAALSEGRSKINALDVDERRLEKLALRADRCGFRNIVATRVASNSFAGIEELVGSADKVIVDAPCTGSGTIRRNPDKKFRLTKSLVERHASYQKELLGHYSKLVKPSGLLYYVTCSIFAEENQSVVSWFLNTDQKYKKVDMSSILVDPKFSSVIEDEYLAIYPHRHEMDGFFAAAMVRVG